MRTFLTLCLISLLAGCQYFGVNFSQGNDLSDSQIKQLRIGMKDQEVSRILGSPVYVNTFNKSQWVYVYTQQKRELMTQRRLLLTFKKHRLTQIQR